MNEARLPARGRLRLYAWASLIFLGAAGVVLCYLLLDEQVVQWLAHHPQRVHRDPWVNAFRQLGKAYVPIWLLLLWSFVTDRWKPTVTVCLALILVSLTVCSLKVIVRRERPNEQIARTTAPAAERQKHTLPWGVSFPSGDTAVVFAVATVLTLLYRGWTPVLFLAAGAVGLLRVTALAHYPSDVLAGALIGVLVAVCVTRVPPDRTAVLRTGGPPQDRFPLSLSWRIGLGLVLAFVVPLLSPFLGMRSLLIFLRVYAVPVAVLMGAGALVGLTKGTRSC